MTTNRLVAALTLAALVLAGCRDLATAPEGASPGASQAQATGQDSTDATEQGCVTAGGCTLDPIVVVAPAPEDGADDPCDIDPNSGECGGSSGGSGGGSWSGSGGLPAPSSTSGDFVQDTIPPNCAAPQSPLEIAACSSAFPAGDWLQRTRDALSRIEGRGEACAAIAARGWELLGRQQIRYYPRQAGLGGGYGNGVVGVLLEDLWVTSVFDRKDSWGRNLDWGLAHELEHVMGRAHSHTDASGVEHTPNDTRCAG